MKLKHKLSAIASATLLGSVAVTAAGVSPASAASSCDSFDTVQNQYFAGGSDASPWSYNITGVAGTVQFCVDAPDATNVNVEIQQYQDGVGWVTVATDNTPGGDKVVSFDLDPSFYKVYLHVLDGGGWGTVGLTQPKA